MRSWIVSRGKTNTSPVASATRRRKGIAALAGLALALGVSVVAAPMARAADGPWTIDGTVADSGATLLEPPVEPFGNVKELGPKNSNTTKIGVIHTAPTPMLEKTNPNAQVDLRRAWIGTKRDGANQDGDVWLYFAWERDSNSGSGFIAYEFMHQAAPTACAYSTATEADLIANCNPWKNRQAGDFMILWDQSGSSTTLYKRVWASSGGGLVLGAPVPLTDATSQAAFSTDKFKGEAAVNLTAEIFDPSSTTCESFANTIPSTVTGNSDTADYKDTILQQAPPISNCGQLTVNKVVINDDGGKAVASDFSFTLTKTGGSSTTQAFESDGSNTFTGLNGTYNATETPISGYTMTINTCKDIVVGPGDNKSCTITNDDEPGTLIVHKVVTNNDGGTKKATDFSFSVNGATAVAFTQDGANPLLGKNTLTPVSAGTYTVTEPAVSGYTSDASDCASVVVPNGGTGECTIYNNDQPGTLIVKKIVINDNGGTKKATDFTFQVNGGSAITFLQDGLETLLGKNTLTVNAGQYTVTEPAVSGYITSYSNCTNVTVTNGGSATCTITNNDTKASPNGSTTQRWVLHDTFNLSGLRAGASNAATSVTFKLYSNATCTTQVGSSEIASFDGSTATTTTGVAVSSPGTYYWTVTYAGDDYNNGFTTVCGSETTTISRTE